MRKFCATAIFLLSAVSSHAAFYTGADLNRLAEESDRQPKDYQSDAVLMGYVIGAVDQNGRSTFCVSAGVTVGQLVAMVKKYLKENPEKWNLPGDTIVFLALFRTFPCGKK